MRHLNYFLSRNQSLIFPEMISRLMATVESQNKQIQELTAENVKYLREVATCRAEKTEFQTIRTKLEGTSNWFHCFVIQTSQFNLKNQNELLMNIYFIH